MEENENNGIWNKKLRMDDFGLRLKKELLKGLPGTEIQWQMASSDRFIKNFPKSPGKDSREAAVLILLYPYKQSIYTVFMQRPIMAFIAARSVFPGGKKSLKTKI